MKTNYLIWGCVTAIAVIAWGMYYSTIQVPTETIDATAQSIVWTNVDDEKNMEDLLKWATLEAKAQSFREDIIDDTAEKVTCTNDAGDHDPSGECSCILHINDQTVAYSCERNWVDCSNGDWGSCSVSWISTPWVVWPSEWVPWSMKVDNQKNIWTMKISMYEWITYVPKISNSCESNKGCSSWSLEIDASIYTVTENSDNVEVMWLWQTKTFSCHCFSSWTCSKTVAWGGGTILISCWGSCTDCELVEESSWIKNRIGNDPLHSN
jgi:hypothetical protein